MLGVRKFRNSLQILRYYVLRKCPADLNVETRSGLRIHLSGDEDDIATLLVVFGRRDYGEVPKRGVVVDVGAHLGSFSLHAIESGAAKVYSYEPDPVLYDALVQNIEDNGLGARIFPFPAAVVGRAITTVTFYPEGNASGHLTQLPHDSSGISVDALTLGEIVLRNELTRVDLLKLDCEGSEYEIIFSTPTDIWQRIERVRMEYHQGRADELKTHFGKLGFRLIFASQRSPQVGLLAFDRSRRNGLDSQELS
jgi:FkbM family methyltransferase